MMTDIAASGRRLISSFAIAVLVFASMTATLQASTANPESLTVINFNGIAPAGSFVSYGAGPLTLSGATFTSNGSMFVIDPGYYGFPYAGGGFLNSDFVNPDIITVSLSAPVTFVGFDFGSLFTGGATFDVMLGTQGPFTVSSSGSTQTGVLSFIGLTSSTPFSTVTLTMPDSPNYNAIDNFEFGSTPEPTTLLLVGGGLALIARRRKARG